MQKRVRQPHFGLQHNVHFSLQVLLESFVSDIGRLFKLNIHTYMHTDKAIVSVCECVCGHALYIQQIPKRKEYKQNTLYLLQRSSMAKFCKYIQYFKYWVSTCLMVRWITVDQTLYSCFNYPHYLPGFSIHR